MSLFFLIFGICGAYFSACLIFNAIRHYKERDVSGSIQKGAASVLAFVTGSYAFFTGFVLVLHELGVPLENPWFVYVSFVLFIVIFIICMVRNIPKPQPTK